MGTSGASLVELWEQKLLTNGAGVRMSPKRRRWECGSGESALISRWLPQECAWVVMGSLGVGECWVRQGGLDM